MKKGVIAIVLLVFLLAVSIVFSQDNENNDKVDKEVEDLLDEQDEVSVIVVLEDDYETLDDYSVSELNEKSDIEKKKIMVAEQQEQVLSELDLKEENQDNDFDFDLESKFTSINGFSGNVTKEGISKLVSNPDVKSVQINRILSFALDDSIPLVNATNTWKLIYNATNITGKGETVCVVDSGIDYTHPALGNCTTNQFTAGTCGKVLSGYDFKNNDNDPVDDQGHGTHVAGIIASKNETFRGVAPDANLVALKVCDNTTGGNCATADIISAIEWCTDNATVFNISIISISLGGGLSTGYCNDDSIAPSINAAVGQNISVVVAAGNDVSTTQISSPACIQNATAVGSVGDTDTIPSYSNRNNITNLLAPGGANTAGNHIKSTVPTGSCVNCDSSGFKELSGTSMATPHVAGAFALLYQYFKLTENRNATPSEIEDTLNDTGKQIDDTSGSGFFFSRINIFAAIESLDTLSPNIAIINPENSTTKKNISFIVNITSNEVLLNATLEINNTNFTMAGSGTEWNINISSLSDETYNYKIYGNDTFGNTGISETFAITIGNTIPVAMNITINSTDFLNRTNGTLQGFFSFIDVDGDAITANETRWYNNSVEYNLTRNLTSLSPQNTTKGENWTFSVRVFDGDNWSSWVNSTNLTINNAVPQINITIGSITVNETQLVNITLNASDIDLDSLTFTTNRSNDFNITNNQALWYTNLANSGNYQINITVNDTEAISSKIINVTVLDVRDLDNDGNPYFNDTDDDNDGIADGNDFLTGNLSSINTTFTINITINGTTNLSTLFNQTVPINITNGTHPIVEFNFTFNENSTLDLGSITLNRTTNGSSAVSIRGVNLTNIGKTKTVFLEKANTSVTSVCIKDLDIGFDNISSACTGDYEVLLSCNNQSNNGYTCFDTGTRYKITGLNHSAVIERCEDKDGDSYGTGCSSGTDCDDNDASKNTDCSSSEESSSSSSSSGGGGGGGGGSGAFYICNMNWTCTSWSSCEDGWEIRECDFVKVPQHTQSEQCQTINNVPIRATKCEVVKKIEDKTSEVVNQTIKAIEGPSRITGAATPEVKGKTILPIGIGITVLILIIGLVAYTKMFAPKKKK